MRFALVLLGIIAAALFAAQNYAVVPVVFFGWRVEASLAVVMVFWFAVGAIVGSVALAPQLLRRHRTVRILERRVSELESRHVHAATQEQDRVGARKSA